MNFKRLPDVLGLELWGCIFCGYQWVISFDPSEGCRASYKSIKHREKMAIHLDGAPYPTFNIAENSCQAASKELRNPN